ncbi:MAG: sensor histidine kinase [Alkalibacterium gilvum]|uniref:histidine kinase n=1 Tax=Alkalibacterium gilvum TaxID=1130080 RepID=A0A1H6VJL8_9LACT|nr:MULTISPECIES: sensor histidine kinase [Alkalibacterium]MDN6293883.1 sensor histidine kinase [Alkalibacterium sp.]MDN6295537.1 sensor histidine kinase [Alkalibacterium sp.]MDN6735603.1 sensor histidine kinase [Tetragenococcus koreensis]SEJ00435.1 Signal transduction histidine kinase [Alkalibacterium gilvum]
MTIKNYLNDKVVFLGANSIGFLILAGILFYSAFNTTLILYTFLLWFLPLTSFMILDYLKQRKYFKSINTLMDKLDKKYLLPEVITDTHFPIGDEVNDILKVVSRDMHEHINFYKDNKEDYREYIETWVHEIKTPIASSKLIIENNPNETTHKIETQLEKIEDFVEQVLYYSRSNNVEKDYIIRSLNLKHVITDVVKRNAKDFINEKIKLELDAIDTIVYSDAKWLEFIINQLIINAIKYRTPTDAKIHISTQTHENSVTLTICDNGIGIDEKDLSRVFDKGFTGSNGRKLKKSTGIGLYLCKKLCDRLNLQLSINSKPGLGTSVTITFPMLMDHY